MDFKLSEKNYIPIESNKKRIVIGNSFSVDMNHYIGWVTRLNGNFKRTANYTIELNGNVHEHFSPKYYSNYLNDNKLDNTIISIILENEGWLNKDLFNENKYINYVGHIYNREEVVEKRWRNFKFWAPYTDEQMESLTKLVKQLCNDFNIPLNVVSHNTGFKDANKYEGVLYRSNFEKYYTDISPTWDFTTFKNKIEINN
jgi:hypothetical protein